MENKALIGNETDNNRVRVMSKTGYSPRPKYSAGSNAMSILFSVFLILGGLSGRYVLRGTNSSGALVLAGIAFLIWDIVSASRQKAAAEKADSEYSARYGRVSREEKAVAGDQRALPGDVSVRVAYDKSLAALNLIPRLNGRSMEQNARERVYTGGTRQVKNIVSFLDLDLTAVFELPPDAGEIVIELFRDKTGIGISVPGTATLVPQPEG